MKYRTILFWGIICCCLFTFLQFQYKFFFYYQEQLQLFPLTGQYFIDTVSEPAGLAFYLSGFIIQFFALPCMGALLTTFLLVAVALLLYGILRKVSPSGACGLLALFPVAMLLLYHLDINYRMQGTVSFLLMLVFIRLYLYFDRFPLRLILSVLMVFLLFWMAGSVMSLFVVCIILLEVLQRKQGWFYFPVLLFELIIITYASMLLAWQGEYQMIVLPDLYYEPLVKSENIILPWIMLLVSILLAWWFRGRQWFDNYYFFGGQWILVLLFFYWIDFQEKHISLKNMEQDYYLRTEQWDRIISSFSMKHADAQTMNVLNLALACKGELGEKLFCYPQVNEGCLIPEWNSSLGSAIVLADINYYIGNVTFAQKFAFEGCVASACGNVRLLQCLVRTNLITGDYPVAEKYIKLLEQTLFYRDWASRQRRYLYNDANVLQDLSYGEKRKGLLRDDQYRIAISGLETLEYLSVNNPDNPLPLQYLIAYSLLRKDLKTFDGLHKKYYRSKVWQSLATSQQEAIVALYQKTPAVWAQKGVSLKVEQQYGAFDQDMIEKHSFLNFREVMAASFGDTYWFYLMF